MDGSGGIFIVQTCQDDVGGNVKKLFDLNPAWVLDLKALRVGKSLTCIGLARFLFLSVLREFAKCRGDYYDKGQLIAHYH